MGVALRSDVEFNFVINNKKGKLDWHVIADLNVNYLEEKVQTSILKVLVELLILSASKIVNLANMVEFLGQDHLIMVNNLEKNKRLKEFTEHWNGNLEDISLQLPL